MLARRGIRGLAGSFPSFTALVFVLVVVPGPSVLFTISRAPTRGRRDVLLTVLGMSRTAT